MDVEGSARYPFGYGLSYTTFALSEPKLNGNRVSVEITNTGKTKGDDVVQMYLRDMIFTVARPRYELKGFRRVTLEPGDFKVWVTDAFQDGLERKAKSVTYTLK